MIVVKRHILFTINKLDKLYNLSPTNEATYYSKLAVIEFCGWIEVTMDKIAENYVSRNVKTTQFNDIFRSIKENNHGFRYNSNFRKMLIQVLGLQNMEKVEVAMSKSGSIAVLTAQLDMLIHIRNDAAHTFLDTTKTYQAPSVTRQQLNIVYPILRDIHRAITTL